jgi:hypothetical protein
VALELSGLLIANAAYAIVGTAALAGLGYLTWARLGLVLPLGLVLVAIPASYAALIGVPVGLTAAVVGALIVVAGCRRAEIWKAHLRWPPIRRPGPSAAVALGLAVVLAVLLASASRAFAVTPLVDWDGWAVWTAKARLLYADPSIAPQALRSGNYGQAPYPIGLPTVEALGFGAMGQYDGTLIGVQFLLLAAAFPLALWALLRDYARSSVIALAAIAVVGAPQILYQLLTHYADVPLGLFVGLGLAAGAAWLAGPGERWLLVPFVAFLGMAGITKSEGFLFALVGAFSLLVVELAARRGRAQLTACALGVGGVLAVILPWRVYCSVYGLSTPDYDLAHVVDAGYLRDHRDRVSPVVRELWRQLTAQNKWAVLVWVIALALAAGLVAGRWRTLGFAVCWLALSSAGLVVLYWASNLPIASNLDNTSYRTIVSLLVGGASVAPLLVFPRTAKRG